MELRCRFFSDPVDLAKFVNKWNIRRENIQEISKTRYDGYYLFYWEQKDRL